MRFDGNLSGWKAVGAAIFIVGIVALRVTNRMNRAKNDDLPPSAPAVVATVANPVPDAFGPPASMGDDYTIDGVATIPTPGGFSWTQLEVGQNDDGVSFHTLECRKPNSNAAIVLTVLGRAASSDDDRLAILERQYDVVIEALRAEGFTLGPTAPAYGETPVPDLVQYPIQATKATGITVEFRVVARFGKRSHFLGQAASANAAEADWLIDILRGIVEPAVPLPPENLAANTASNNPPPPAPPTAPAATGSSQPSEPAPPPDPPFDGEVIKLGAPAMEAVMGGAGRFLVLHLATKNEAVVVDLPGRKIAFSVPAPEDALLAAGKERLYVVTPSDKQVKCWSLLTGQVEAPGRIDVAGQPKAVAMGYSSTGPILVHWADDSDGRYSLVDPQTWAARQISVDRSGAAPGQVAFSNADKTGIAVRASADGRVFAVWSSFSSRPSERLFVGRTLAIHRAQGGHGHAVPSADGEVICRSSGIYSANGQWRGGTDNRPCYATCDPRFILSINNEGLFIRDARTGAALHTLPPLVEFGQDQFITPYEKSKLQSDRRIFCTPAENLLVTIPKSDDRLLLREIPFNTIAASGDLQADPARPALATFYTPGAISRAVSGGGRLLILHLAERGVAAVFDLAQRKIVGAVPAPDDALIAAGQEKLIVINPGDKRVSRWSLETLQEEASQELDWEDLGVPRVAAMGPASRGPVLVHWTNDQGGAFSLLDVENLTLRPLSRSQPGQRDIGGKVAIQTTGANWGGVAMRASYDGQSFGIWKTSGSPSGVEVLKLGKTPAAKYEHDTKGHVLPTAQGRVLTGNGSFDTKFKFENNGGPYFLTSDPRYAVHLTQEGGAIEAIAGGETLASLPALDEMSKDFVNYCRFGQDLGKLRLMHDQRVFFLLAEQLLVTIPETDDRLVLRKLTIQTPVPQPQTVADSKAPAGGGDVRRRLWTDKSGKFKILARLAAADGNNITLEKTDGTTIIVPLDKLSDTDQQYVEKLGL